MSYNIFAYAFLFFFGGACENFEEKDTRSQNLHQNILLLRDTLSSKEKGRPGATPQYPTFHTIESAKRRQEIFDEGCEQLTLFFQRSRKLLRKEIKKESPETPHDNLHSTKCFFYHGGV